MVDNEEEETDGVTTAPDEQEELGKYDAVGDNDKVVVVADQAELELGPSSASRMLGKWIMSNSLVLM